MITLLDQNTINKIAAGEVVERPSAVVKELVENSIDAGANGITVEIKEGGTSFIRITDNGTGIVREDISLAFKRHSTSKIKSAEDLLTVKSLGFRGEALASIAAVAQAELVTKTPGSLTGSRYVIEGGEEKILEEIGCPEGTTFIVRNLFYNTPARRKFLKSPMTEAGYVSDLVEKLAISHPEIAFKFINNNQVKLQTSGNHNLKDIIYHVYGRDITSHILPIAFENEWIKISGFIGKPILSRGNRNYMNYFINGRYIKSNIINQGIEEAYKPYTMTHRYPFTVMSFEIDSGMIDVNVHPTKMEVRFIKQEDIFHLTCDAVSNALRKKELISEVTLDSRKEKSTGKNTKETEKAEKTGKTEKIENVESFEKRAEIEPLQKTRKDGTLRGPEPFETKRMLDSSQEAVLENNIGKVEEETAYSIEEPTQVEMDNFLTKESQKEHHMIGQLFSTYWLIEYEEKLFIIDQHAAHEKVLYEKIMGNLKKREFLSQMINPPIILTLNMGEEEVLLKNKNLFEELGFEIEHFGGREYSVRAVPANLCNIAEKELLLELIDGLVEIDGKSTPEILLEKVASMSCKAAVKGNMRLSEREAKELIDQLLLLENPYHCPHGRPTIISMTKYELEKKFKRIV